MPMLWHKPSAVSANIYLHTVCVIRLTLHTACTLIQPARAAISRQMTDRNTLTYYKLTKAAANSWRGGKKLNAEVR
jgi:hypothetical protein